jgi:hypothetical protein
MEQKPIQRPVIPLKEQTHLIQVSGFHLEHDRIVGQRVQSGSVNYVIFN